MSVSSPDRLQLPASLTTQLHDFRKRVWTIKSIEAGCGALFGVMVIRYAWLQLVEGDALSERMRNQVGYDFAIQSPRGTITDRTALGTERPPRMPRSG